MSDYISKSEFIEQINRYEKELSEDRKLAVCTDDEIMLFAISNQETAIYRIKRCIQHELTTVDEKDIIHKTVERIVNRLKKKIQASYTKFNNITEMNAYDDGIDDSIEIVKKEGTE